MNPGAARQQPFRDSAPPVAGAWLPIGAVTLVASLVIGIAVVAVEQEKERYRERASRSTENIARLMGQQLDDTFSQVDAILRVAAYAYRERAAQGRIDPAALEAMLVHSQSLLAGLESLRITDRAGLVRHGQNVPVDQPVDLSDRDFFRKARDQPESALIVSGPVFARISRKWVVVLARPVLDSRGDFAGVVYANLATDFFGAVLGEAMLGPKGAATLRTADLALVHRAPPLPDKVGTKDVSAQLRAAIAARPEWGTYIAPTALDGIERSNSYRRLSGYPFYVLVGMATDDYLGGWRQNVVAIGSMAGLAVLATLVSGALVLRAQRRLRADLAERTRVAHELELAMVERGRLIDELAETADHAKAADRAKTAFLANMSHEIRTPLNGMVGMAYLVRQGGLTPQQAARMDKLEASAAHLLEVINAILDLSKIEAGRLVLEERALDLRRIVADVVAIVEPKAVAQGIRLTAEPADLPGPVVGDATRLQQALLNYAHNAVKFTARGHVTLRVKVLEDRAGDALLRFEVEDTGVGIDGATLQRLFAHFEQADASTTRRYGGSGLGLAITRRLAELMGGDAGAQSEPGVGSTFWFTARLRKAAPAPERASPPIVAAESARDALKRRFAGARVLVVEDNEINRMVAVSQLEQAGLVADTAEDGAQAVAKVRADPPRIVLMDIQMPVMDGLEATRLIRQDAAGRTIPIIAVTANAFAEDRARCAEAGMDDFLAKPVGAEALQARVLAWLERSDAR